MKRPAETLPVTKLEVSQQNRIVLAPQSTGKRLQRIYD